MSYPVVHFEIIGKDAARTQGFYRDLFGWKIDANNPMAYGLVEADAPGGIAGGIGGGEESGRLTFYVQADDPQAVLDKAESLGGKTIMGVTEIPGAATTIAMFQDLDGNVVGLLKSPEA